MSDLISWKNPTKKLQQKSHNQIYSGLPTGHLHKKRCTITKSYFLRTARRDTPIFV